MGATFYELLTGKPPFFSGDISLQILSVPTQPISERLRDFGLANPVPAQVAALIMACLAKEPEHRPQSARVIAEWIDLADRRVSMTVPVVEEESAPPEADSGREEAGSDGGSWWSPKRAWLAWVGAALVTLAAIAWAVLGTRVNAHRENAQPVETHSPEQLNLANLPPGLALYYSFDSAPSNSSVPDLSPQFNHGCIRRAQGALLFRCRRG
jgi:serine/threonine protein kinase